MKVHWFNPENDLALAADATIYTPKRAAQQLHDAGSVLPLWYADDNDKVLCYGVNALWYDRIRREFGIEAQIFDHKPMSGQIPDPWGWSTYAKRYFLDEGFAADTMPSDAQLAKMRRLSHRSTTIEIANMLRDKLPHIKLADAATEAFSIEEVKAWLQRHDRGFIKFPWSSSGRGVFDTASTPIENILKMADDSIRRQGSVMIEKAYDRVIDFARLYECHEGKCMTVGTSVFSTDKHDSYTGNVLGSEDYLLSLIEKHCQRDTIEEVFEALSKVIEEIIAPYYEGILGIDMLIDADGTIDAVVEINLRKTMGYVARRFADRFMRQEDRGIFSALPTTSFCDKTSAYVTADYKLLSGTLYLTPNNQNFTFAATIIK